MQKCKTSMLNGPSCLIGNVVRYGNIKSKIEKTYELVMKGYDDFLASKLPKPETPAEPASAKVN